MNIRIYNPVNEEDSAGPRPVLLFVPPVAGSIPVINSVCIELRARGFVVVSYSRPGFDSPAVDSNGSQKRLFMGIYRLVNALTRGLTDVQANAGGRELEEGRTGDIQFLLRELSQNKTFQDKMPRADRNTVFLAGYGAGGAAAVILASSAEFTERNYRVRAVIGIESPILSSLEGEPQGPSLPPPGNPVSAFFRNVQDFAEGFIPRKITHIGNIPRPEIPVMFLVSDRVIQNRTGRYETVLRTISASKNSALLAAVPGAGPFDYSDSPRLYPVYSFLFRGTALSAGSSEPAALTASLITNFAAMVTAPKEAEEAITIVLQTSSLDKAIHLETGGVWNLSDSRFILEP
jgi:hypothetical protein